MWRGPTWVNANYVIIEGLRRRGRPRIAEGLAELTVGQVRRQYEQRGVLFEFYDSSDERAPCDCDRKGPRRSPYDLRVKMDSIRDYHWTAALTARLLVDRAGRQAPRG
jgi:hypothetical protein